jgi:hypothetical protein
MALPPDDFQRLIKMLSEAEPARPEITEEEFQMRLMSEGAISELPRPLHIADATARAESVSNMKWQFFISPFASRTRIPPKNKADGSPRI